MINPTSIRFKDRDTMVEFDPKSLDQKEIAELCPDRFSWGKPIDYIVRQISGIKQPQPEFSETHLEGEIVYGLDTIFTPFGHELSAQIFRKPELKDCLCYPENFKETSSNWHLRLTSNLYCNFRAATRLDFIEVDPEPKSIIGKFAHETGMPIIDVVTKDEYEDEDSGRIAPGPFLLDLLYASDIVANSILLNKPLREIVESYFNAWRDYQEVLQTHENRGSSLEPEFSFPLPYSSRGSLYIKHMGDEPSQETADLFRDFTMYLAKHENVIYDASCLIGTALRASQSFNNYRIAAPVYDFIRSNTISVVDQAQKYLDEVKSQDNIDTSQLKDKAQGILIN